MDERTSPLYLSAQLVISLALLGFGFAVRERSDLVYMVVGALANHWLGEAAAVRERSKQPTYREETTTTVTAPAPTLPAPPPVEGGAA